MPCSPLQFLHAANAFLGSPVWLPGEPRDDVRTAAAQATLTAFRNVVQECVERDIDFLLLCGNTFVDTDRSLAARVALRDGLERLASAGIPVFVLPGAHDPADAWNAIPDLPDNATIFADDSDPVEVTRDGEVVAVVGHETAPDGDPVRIALRLVDDDWRGDVVAASCDYLALGGEAPCGTQHAAGGVAHHPGTTQPLTPAGGNGSCTLVVVDESRQFRLTNLPTAGIRFEHLRKTLDQGDTLDNLLQTLPGKLALRPAADGELVRCIRWTLNGDGPLWESLQMPETNARIERELSTAATGNVPAVVHHVELARSHANATLPDGIADEFALVFAETPDSTPDDVRSRLSELATMRTDWWPRLERLAGRISAAAVMADANHAGRQRLEQPADVADAASIGSEAGSFRHEDEGWDA